MKITDTDRARIVEAIAAAEKRTSGEIVAIVTAASDDYRHLPLLWAAAAALIVPLVLINLGGWPVQSVYLAQLGVFAVLAVVLSLAPVRRYIVPRALGRRRAHRLAVDQFLAQNLHTTEGRTGVMIFVSTAERYAEIVADEGIYRKADRSVWDDAVAALTSEIAAGRVGEGFERAIKTCGAVLAEHFPAGKDNHDELPNRLIIL